jgi:hypothetical protein
VSTGGDKGTLQIEIPALNIKQQQVLVLGAENVTDGVKLRRTSTAGLVMATFNTNLTIAADAVELWWPAGYGKQPLYDVIVSFTPASMEAACAVPDDSDDGTAGATRKLLDTFIAAAAEEADYRSENPLPMGGTFVASSGNLPPACAAAVKDFSTFRRRIGFRTVELVRVPIADAVKDIFPEGEKGWGQDAGFYQQKDNSDGHWAQTKDGIWKHFDKSANQSNVDGESFYFKVNDVPIYMKVRAAKVLQLYSSQRNHNAHSMRRGLCCSAPTGTWLFTCAVGNRSTQTQLTLLWLAANCLRAGRKLHPVPHRAHQRINPDAE